MVLIHKTNKDLILEVLNGATMSRPEIVAKCVAQGRNQRSVERRLTELVAEGRVEAIGSVTDRQYRARKGSPIYDADIAVGMDQRIRVLTDERDKLTRLYKKALQYKDLSSVLLDAYAKYGQIWSPVQIPKYEFAQRSSSEEVAVPLLSDWHFWETTDLQETGGLGEYNMDIAAGYMQYLVDKTIYIFQQVHSGITYRRCYVLLLGDFVSTNIHEVLQHSAGTAVDSLLEGQVVLGRYLMDLAQVYEEVHVRGVVGNHGRLQEKKTYTKRYANWDYVLYNQLAMMLTNQSNIYFSFPKSFFDIVEIEGHKVLLLHGDDIKSWNQIPWYGIDRAIRRFRELLNAHGKDFEYVVLGHFHNTGALEMCRGEKLINGSALGISNFSLGRLFTGNFPHQTIVSCHKEHGFTWRQPVQLRTPDKPRYKIDRAKQIHETWSYMLDHGVEPTSADPLVDTTHDWQENMVE